MQGISEMCSSTKIFLSSSVKHTLSYLNLPPEMRLQGLFSLLTPYPFTGMGLRNECSVAWVFIKLKQIFFGDRFECWAKHTFTVLFPSLLQLHLSFSPCLLLSWCSYPWEPSSLRAEREVLSGGWLKQGLMQLGARVQSPPSAPALVLCQTQ